MEENGYKFFGKHYFASFIDCDPVAINNIDSLRLTMVKGIEKSGATILSYTEKIFDNNGYTILFLLSESHCSVHTYPENNSLFTDLFTCGDTCNYLGFQDEMMDFLKPNSLTSDLIIRDDKHHYS